MYREGSILNAGDLPNWFRGFSVERKFSEEQRDFIYIARAKNLHYIDSGRVMEGQAELDKYSIAGTEKRKIVINRGMGGIFLGLGVERIPIEERKRLWRIKSQKEGFRVYCDEDIIEIPNYRTYLAGQMLKKDMTEENIEKVLEIFDDIEKRVIDGWERCNQEKLIIK